MLRYALYARRSSDREDRQEKSIEDQLTDMYELARRRGLQVVDEIIESRSALKPHNRPEFDRMIEMLLKGEVDAILTYHANRLSRNRLESGLIEQYLQDGIIKEIVTDSRTYYPEDNAFIFAIEGLQANQFSRDHAKVVADRMELRAKRGWMPNGAPAGYLNDRFEKIIVADPERFDTLRLAWNWALEGKSLRAICKSLKELGYTTPKKTKRGGKPIRVSTLKGMLNNIFYTGLFSYKGEFLKGNHPPMVTMEEFEAVQRRLHANTAPKGYEFPYTGLIKCAECGCAVTATKKTKRLASGDITTYTYYHCTNSRGICANRKEAIEEKSITQLLLKVAEGYELYPEFYEWAYEICKRWQGEQVAVREEVFEQQYKTIAQIERQLDRLLELLMDNVISQEDYTRKQAQLKEHLNAVRKNQVKSQQSSDAAREKIEKAVGIIEQGKEKLLHGSIQDRRDVAAELAGAYFLKQKQLIVEPDTLLPLVRTAYEKTVRESLGIEPEKICSETLQKADLDHVRTVWWTQLNDLRTKLAQLALP